MIHRTECVLLLLFLFCFGCFCSFFFSVIFRMLEEWNWESNVRRKKKSKCAFKERSSLAHPLKSFFWWCFFAVVVVLLSLFTYLVQCVSPSLLPKSMSIWLILRMYFWFFVLFFLVFYLLFCFRFFFITFIDLFIFLFKFLALFELRCVHTHRKATTI